MREFLNENTLYGTIAMIIQEHVGTILVVEGQYDKLALQGHSERGLEILPGFGGREHITRVAKIAEERGLGRVRFLVDRDYDPYITDSPKRPSNMMVSEAHDLFVDLLMGEPLRLLSMIETMVYGVESARNSIGARSREVLNAALKRSAQLAAFRIVNAQLGLGLSFESARLSGGLKGVHSFYDMSEFLLRVNDRGSANSERLASRSETVFTTFRGEYWNVVGDHDLIDALGVELRKIGVRLGRNELQRTVVAMTSCKAIRSSAWFEEFQAWCRGHGLRGLECDSERVLSA
ncbi:hypothetical protein [Brachybacterium paraconglomeratum]|uniref:hypothetical protein n=1 Tax=Brachybacterium paraconglomeratum TaxID=173362 RepID=UPI00223B0875|nr:hypothetical protein [Brachybacterium paraconglomeratum]MCT1436516.1 hypothetical protein [Brachybacterium paraconglomeratum]